LIKDSTKFIKAVFKGQSAAVAPDVGFLSPRPTPALEPQTALLFCFFL